MGRDIKAMGDMSAEPSMEEILSSIKRIIAEEGEGTQARSRRPRTQPHPIDAGPVEVLELSDPMPATPEPVAQAAYEPEPEPAPAPRVQAAPQPAAAAPQPTPVSAPAQPTRAQTVQPSMSEEPILSHRTTAASLGSLETLSKLLVKPESESTGTLEGLVREMLRPMLREWLDANLPDLVETIVAREIAKITAQMR